MTHRLLTGLTRLTAPTPSVGPTTLILDEFTDTNGTNLTAHTIAPTNTPATIWSALSGTAAVQSNVARFSAFGYYTVNAGVADCTVSMRAKRAGNGTTGAVLRVADANNLWVVGIATLNLVNIFQLQGGVFTLRASGAFSNSVGTFYDVSAVMSGDTISAYAGGNLICSYALAAMNNTSTVHGLRGADNNDEFDNFQVTVP